MVHPYKQGIDIFGPPQRTQTDRRGLSSSLPDNLQRAAPQTRFVPAADDLPVVDSLDSQSLV